MAKPYDRFTEREPTQPLHGIIDSRLLFHMIRIMVCRHTARSVVSPSS